MALKPQDVYVVLKLVAAGSRRAPYSHLALELVMSPSEVHASVKRASVSGLLHGPGLENRPNIGALEEFLTRGLKYVFPAERGAYAGSCNLLWSSTPACTHRSD